MTAKGATYVGADITAESEVDGRGIFGEAFIAEPEFDGCAVLVDSSVTATEVVEVPVKLSDM